MANIELLYYAGWNPSPPSPERGDLVFDLDHHFRYAPRGIRHAVYTDIRVEYIFRVVDHFLNYIRKNFYCEATLSRDSIRFLEGVFESSRSYMMNSLQRFIRTDFPFGKDQTVITNYMQFPTTPLQEIKALQKQIDAMQNITLQSTLPTPSLGKLPELPKPVPAEFEVNLVEPLIGWKRWKFNALTGLLESQHNCVWTPDQPNEARCPAPCGDKTPNEHHTCGFYAVNNIKDTATNYMILGEIYGWGRYVRGTQGWRSQFAYPKNFVLDMEQEQYIEPLKKYHVPILMKEPVRIFDPVDEGFEEQSEWT